MRKFILASAFAIAAALSFATPSQAGAGITVQIGDGGRYYHHHRHHDRHWRHWRHDRWRDYRHSRYGRHHYRDHRRCYEERVIRFYHGRRYMEVRRFCR